MKVGFYAGSFDPFTNGHLHVISVASNIFDRVIIGIGNNSDKSRRVDRYKMCVSINNVLIANRIFNAFAITYDGFTFKTAQEFHTSFFIRGIRDTMDYEYEEKISSFNKENSSIDTIYIRSNSSISSSMVMQQLSDHKDISMYVPEEIEKLIKEEIKID